MAIDFDNLKTIYQSNIDSVIDGLGKSIELHFEETVTNISDDSIDQVHSGHKLPSFKNDGSTTSENTEVIRGLLMWNPAEAEDFGINISDDRPVIRFKTYLTEGPKLIRAAFMIAIESDQITGRKFQLQRGPLPRGMGNERYCVTYWKAV